MISNFMIYYNNLSTYYVICVFVSVIAVILSWVFHFKSVPMEHDSIDTSKAKSKEELETDQNELKQILTTFKEKKKEIIETLTANLTEDQLQEEKQTEREQLAAILKLLKEQEDKFHVGSMEELEGQLKLYR